MDVSRAETEGSDEKASDVGLDTRSEVLVICGVPAGEKLTELRKL